MSNNNNDNSDNRLCNKTTIRRITFYFGGRGGVKRNNVKISRKGSNAHAHFVFRLLEYCVHSSALKRNLGIVSNVRRVLVALVGFSTTFFLSSHSNLIKFRRQLQLTKTINFNVNKTKRKIFGKYPLVSSQCKGIKLNQRRKDMK